MNLQEMEKESAEQKKRVDTAFERFRVWCIEREIPETLIERYMLMHDDGNYYQFKNIKTRNYIYVNKVPTPFNL